jgi:hypothetical protein
MRVLTGGDLAAYPWIVVQRLARCVPLTQGKVAWVDVADYEAVMLAGPWHAHKRNSGIWYAQRHVYIGNSNSGRKKTQYLHQFLNPSWPLTDHKNGDGLNCRRNNMREATVVQNHQNRKMHANNTSRLKGVGWNKRDKRWRARIRVNGKLKQLGTFDGPPPPAPAPREAGRAYDKAALELFGEFARTNVMLGLLPPLPIQRDQARVGGKAKPPPAGEG